MFVCLVACLLYQIGERGRGGGRKRGIGRNGKRIRKMKMSKKQEEDEERRKEGARRGRVKLTFIQNFKYIHDP